MLDIIKYDIPSDFESLYVKTRASEDRLLTVEEIRNLPSLKKKNLGNEWKKRIKSTQRIIEYVKQNPLDNLLDIGCGNGWLIYKLAPFINHLDAIDVNLPELEQAAEVLSEFNNVSLIYGDIYKIAIEKKYDLIILNASVQYFSDIQQLINHLLSILNPSGSIHFVDSPFYNKSEVQEAKQRSIKYYTEIGHPNMKNYYHHHCWEDLSFYNYKILYKPTSLINRLSNKLGIVDSPFPWIQIKPT